MSDTGAPNRPEKSLRDYVGAIVGLTILLPVAIIVGVFRRKILRRR